MVALNVCWQAMVVERERDMGDFALCPIKLEMWTGNVDSLLERGRDRVIFFCTGCLTWQPENSTLKRTYSHSYISTFLDNHSSAPIGYICRSSNAHLCCYLPPRPSPTMCCSLNRERGPRWANEIQPFIFERPRIRVGRKYRFVGTPHISRSFHLTDFRFTLLGLYYGIRHVLYFTRSWDISMWYAELFKTKRLGAKTRASVLCIVPILLSMLYIAIDGILPLGSRS